MAVFTSYLFLQLLVAFLDGSFKPLSSHFPCLAGFPETFCGVLCCLLGQRRDTAFQIVNLHPFLGQSTLQSLEYGKTYPSYSLNYSLSVRREKGGWRHSYPQLYRQTVVLGPLVAQLSLQVSTSHLRILSQLNSTLYVLL